MGVVRAKKERNVTYSEFLNLDVKVCSHSEKAFEMKVIQKDIHRNPSDRGVNYLFKNVDISKHIHGNCNDLCKNKTENKAQVHK